MTASLTERERGTGLLLLCRVDSRVCAFPIEHVSESMRPLPVEPLSGMPPSVLGLSVIRGTPMPVVDAGRLLGAIAPRHPARFVTIKTRGRQVALAVDAVIGVRSLDGPLLEDLPPLLAEANAEVVSAIGTLDADLLLVLRSARLLPDFDWTALETRGGP